MYRILRHYFSWERDFSSTCDSVREQQMTGRKKNWKVIRKQLFLNHWLTLSSPCVAYLSIFPIYLAFAYLPSICSVNRGPCVQMWTLWDIVDQCLVADKLTWETDSYCSYFAQQIHFAVFICAVPAVASRAEEKTMASSPAKNFQLGVFPGQMEYVFPPIF